LRGERGRADREPEGTAIADGREISERAQAESPGGLEIADGIERSREEVANRGEVLPQAAAREERLRSLIVGDPLGRVAEEQLGRAQAPENAPAQRGVTSPGSGCEEAPADRPLLVE